MDTRHLIKDEIFNEMSRIAIEKFGYKKKGKDSMQLCWLKGMKYAESHPELHDYFRK